MREDEVEFQYFLALLDGVGQMIGRGPRGLGA